MAAGASDIAFRAQLVLPEQQQLFDYWCEKRNRDTLPTRQQIRPAEIARLLPDISLIDIETDPLNFRFRLAGTRVRDIYDREVTGLEIADFDGDQNRDYWTRTYAHISQSGKPAQGVVRGPSAEKEHLVQFWLRLPLAVLDNRPAMLLCHDALVPAGEMSDVSMIAHTA